tara:strand:+ start:285 stop:644 length:360 start_codon:yes stop_codon:yes gene_type:complete
MDEAVVGVVREGSGRETPREPVALITTGTSFRGTSSFPMSCVETPQPSRQPRAMALSVSPPPPRAAGAAAAAASGRQNASTSIASARPVRGSRSLRRSSVALSQPPLEAAPRLISSVSC